MVARSSNKNAVAFWFLLEIICLVLVFWLTHGNSPPDVNEAHYLTKAKHYWNPAFCPDDFFLSSADAHLVFYWVCGWLTLFFDLETVAWVGRAFSWVLLASSLVSIGQRVCFEKLAGLFVGGAFVILTEVCHLAGEWVVGGFEAKTIAYGLAFWGIRFAMDARWRGVWLLTGTAAAFHVLAGGWIVFCLIVFRIVSIKLKGPRPTGKELVGLVVGGLVALGGLIPGLLLSSGDAEIAAEANRLYVHVRLPHHLVITTFAVERWALFSSLTGGTLLLWINTGKWRCDGQRVIVGIGLVSVIVAIAGIVITISLGNDSTLQHSLLRFYFYRTSDTLVPLAASLLAGLVVFRVAEETGKGWRLSASILLLMLGLYVGDRIKERHADPRPRGDVLTLPSSKKTDPEQRRANTLRIHRHWRLACLWMKNNTPHDAIAITPLRQQTFKWYSHRGEVVTRKDMPQDAKSLLQWHERRESVYPFVGGRRGLSRLDDDYLLASCRHYGADYLVLTQFSESSRNRFADDVRIEKVFPPAGRFSYYAVYKLKD